MDWRSQGGCAIRPSLIPPLAGSRQTPLPWGKVALMPLIVAARGSWDLQGPFYVAPTLCHIVCRGYLATLRKQGQPLYAALQTIFAGRPLYPALG